MSKSNKFLLTIVFLTMNLTGCLANNNQQESGDKPTHKHHLVIKHDLELHWAECSYCGLTYQQIGVDDSLYDDDSLKLITHGDFRYEEPHHFRFNDEGIFFEEGVNEIEYRCFDCNAIFILSIDHDENNHWYTLTDSQSHKSKVLETLSHSFEIVEIINPTYEAEGYTIEKCVDCYYEHKTEFTKKLEHTFDSNWAYDDKGHWHECLDYGYSDLRGDYEEHNVIETHDYVEGDLHGGLIHRKCSCGYSLADEYEFSPEEKDTLKYLDFVCRGNNIVMHTNELANIELPTKLVYPEYLQDEYGRWQPLNFMYTTVGEVYWSAADCIEEIYLPSTFLGYYYDYYNYNSSYTVPFFKYFKGLKEIYVDEDNPYFSSSNGVLFSKDGKKAISVPQNKEFASGLIINEKTWNEIGDYAFYNCTSITSITIPNSVNKIGSNAFDGCEALSSVIFNGTTTEWQAIENHSNLTGVVVHCSDGDISL